MTTDESFALAVPLLESRTVVARHDSLRGRSRIFEAIKASFVLWREVCKASTSSGRYRKWQDFVFERLRAMTKGLCVVPL